MAAWHHDTILVPIILSSGQYPHPQSPVSHVVSTSMTCVPVSSSHRAPPPGVLCHREGVLKVNLQANQYYTPPLKKNFFLKTLFLCAKNCGHAGSVSILRTKLLLIFIYFLLNNPDKKLSAQDSLSPKVLKGNVLNLGSKTCHAESSCQSSSHGVCEGLGRTNVGQGCKQSALYCPPTPCPLQLHVCELWIVQKNLQP